MNSKFKIQNSQFSLPRYVRYKDSGVEWLGEVPEHWEVRRVKSIFRMVMEPAPKNNSEELLSVYTHIGVEPRKDLEEKGNKASTTDGYWRVQVGDIIVNKLLAWMGAIGLSKYEGVTSPAYDILRPFVPTAGWYYHYLFRTKSCTSELKRHSRGIMDMRLRLYFDKFGDVLVPYPAFDEQDRIVAFLDQKTAEIDALIAKKQRQIELLDEQKAILINRAVTRGLNPKAKLKPSGGEWIGDIPVHWEVKRLRYLCVVGTGERDTKNSISDGAYPFFVRSQTPEQINSYGFDCEAVLTAGDGAGVGKVFHHFVGKFDAHQRVYVMRDFVEVLGRYFFLYLRENFHRVALTGDAKSTVDSLRRSMLTDFPIPLPPADEQLAIIQHCDEISKKIADLGKATLKEIQSLKTLRSTLIAHAVIGRIKV